MEACLFKCLAQNQSHISSERNHNRLRRFHGEVLSRPLPEEFPAKCMLERTQPSESDKADDELGAKDRAFRVRNFHYYMYNLLMCTCELHRIHSGHVQSALTKSGHVIAAI